MARAGNLQDLCVLQDGGDRSNRPGCEELVFLADDQQHGNLELLRLFEIVDLEEASRDRRITGLCDTADLPICR